MNKISSGLGLLLLLIGIALLWSPRENAVIENDSEYDYLIDLLADSGLFGNTELFQERLLEDRKIVTTSSVNAHFARDLISKLLILQRSSGEEPIDIYVRTEGGWEADVFAVIDVIRSISAPVNIHAIGEVHSAGLVLLVSATGKGFVYPETILGFHCVSDDDREINADRYLGFFRANSKLPEDWLEDESGQFYYFSAEDALLYGVADEILVHTKP